MTDWSTNRDAKFDHFVRCSLLHLSIWRYIFPFVISKLSGGGDALAPFENPCTTVVHLMVWTFIGDLSELATTQESCVGNVCFLNISFLLELLVVNSCMKNLMFFLVSLLWFFLKNQYLLISYSHYPFFCLICSGLDQWEIL